MRHVLLIHGNSGTSNDMKRLEVVFRDNCVVHNYDLPLHGSNINYKGELSIDTCTEYLEDLLNDQHVTEVDVIGFSDGANIAMEMLSRNRIVINNAFLISPNVSFAGVKTSWQIPIYAVQYLTYPLKAIGYFCRIHSRMKMMTGFHFKGTPLRLNTYIRIYYAEHDCFKQEEQLSVSTLFNNEITIIKSTNHLNILKSRELYADIQMFRSPAMLKTESIKLENLPQYSSCTA